MQSARPRGSVPEAPEEYRAENLFRVPPEAGWTYPRAHTRYATMGQCADDAMRGLERATPALKDVLPRDSARPALDEQGDGQRIALLGNIQVGDPEGRSKDVLGCVSEDLLSQFARAAGKKGDERYPLCGGASRLVALLEPSQGRGSNSPLQSLGG